MKPTTTQLKRICYLSKKLQNIKRPMAREAFDRLVERAQRSGLAQRERYIRLREIDIRRMEACRAVKEEIESFLKEILPEGSVIYVNWMKDYATKDEA